MSPMRDTCAESGWLLVTPCSDRSPTRLTRYWPSPALLAETLELSNTISGYRAVSSTS